MNVIVIIVGFVLLWAATDVGRKKDSKIKIFSWEWFLILILIVVGVTLINYNIK